MSGELTDAARTHLGEALDMADELGARQVHVDLGDVEAVDAARDRR
jgi:hypothetical protein